MLWLQWLVPLLARAAWRTPLLTNAPMRRMQACFTLQWSEKIQPAWANFRACMKSEPG